jgi:hypothetical protein
MIGLEILKIAVSDQRLPSPGSEYTPSRFGRMRRQCGGQEKNRGQELDDRCVGYSTRRAALAIACSGGPLHQPPSINCQPRRRCGFTCIPSRELIGKKAGRMPMNTPGSIQRGSGTTAMQTGTGFLIHLKILSTPKNRQTGLPTTLSKPLRCPIGCELQAYFVAKQQGQKNRRISNKKTGVLYDALIRKQNCFRL